MDVQVAKREMYLLKILSALRLTRIQLIDLIDLEKTPLAVQL